MVTSNVFIQLPFKIQDDKRWFILLAAYVFGFVLHIGLVEEGDESEESDDEEGHQGQKNRPSRPQHQRQRPSLLLQPASTVSRLKIFLHYNRWSRS